MEKIKWDEKYFSKNKLFVWIFDGAGDVRKEDKEFKLWLKKMYYKSKEQKRNNLIINKTKEK